MLTHDELARLAADLRDVTAYHAQQIAIADGADDEAHVALVLRAVQAGAYELLGRMTSTTEEIARRDGATYREIGRVSGVSEQAAHKRLNRG